MALDESQNGEPREVVDGIGWSWGRDIEPLMDEELGVRVDYVKFMGMQAFVVSRTWAGSSVC